MWTAATQALQGLACAGETLLWRDGQCTRGLKAQYYLYVLQQNVHRPVVVYMDDLLCYNSSLEQHLHDVQEVLASGAPRPQGVLSDFTPQTDNQAVLWLRTKRDINRFMAHWLDEVEEFCFDIEHVPGSLNPAYPLTRRSLPGAAGAGGGGGPQSDDRCCGGRRP